MIRSYLLIAGRSLLKNKLFSFINVFGLALSMSVGIIVLIRLSDALSYDSFHSNPRDIYRVISKVTNTQNESWRLASSPLPLSTAIQEQAPNSIISTKIYPAIHSVLKDETRELDISGVFVEPGFFRVLGFQLQQGNASSIDKPNVVILSESFARKFFGDADAIGNVVTIVNFGEFEVGGVMNTPPSKSHIDYDVFVSMTSVSAFEQAKKLPSKLNDWNSFEQGYTYVRASTRDIASLIRSLDVISDNINSDQGRIDFELQALKSISPSPSDIYNEIGRSPSRGSLAAEFGIVMIILVAACFNYTNLSIARALTRGKEIGVRKLSGATRIQVIGQYVIEAILVAVLAFVLAIFIMAPILEYQPFNDGYEMIPDSGLSWRLIGLIAIFTLLCGLMAGVFPAWLLSAFKPVTVLRGIASEKLMGHMSLRKTLLVFQFSLSLVVLVFLSTFYRQFNFLASADPGFSRIGVILVPKGINPEASSGSFEYIEGVEMVGFTSAQFGRGSSLNMSREKYDVKPGVAEYYSCDRNWIDMMELKVVSGTKRIEPHDNVIINERSAAVLGFNNADDAVGSVIYLRDSVKVTIAGVVEDFYSHGYGNAVRPLVLQSDSTGFRSLAVKTRSNSPNILKPIEIEWRKNNPAHAFEYISLDDEIVAGRQTATTSLIGFLGLITLSIASLGLLGLVVYTVEVRRKEIGIRKIIGASVRQVIILLSSSFLALLLVAGLIALPIGFILSEIFLTNFVNHVHVSWIQLTTCFILLLTIGLITIFSQTFKAGIENPAANLRSE